jgi:H2-forming N5,N10-methylenetetrahydromethanopterin dehydrogenase-like enzyme
MSLIIEDGTGIPDADAYISIPYVSQYFRGERLEAWETLTVDKQEDAIISATRYVDTAYEWLGTQKTLEQGLQWPRDGVTVGKFEIIGVPKAVKQATAECIAFVMDNVSFYSEDASAKVTSEQVDTIKITYADPIEVGANVATKFEVLNNILRGLYRLDDTASKGSSVGSAKVKRV